jgi:hypothetical protein
MSSPPTDPLMPLEEALAVFQRHGLDVSGMSEREFKKAYYGLAFKFQNNEEARPAMATINAAKAAITPLYQSANDRGGGAFGRASARSGSSAPLRDLYRAALAEKEYAQTRSVLDKIVGKPREEEASLAGRVQALLRRAFHRS